MTEKILPTGQTFVKVAFRFSETFDFYKGQMMFFQESERPKCRISAAFIINEGTTAKIFICQQLCQPQLIITNNAADIILGFDCRPKLAEDGVKGYFSVKGNEITLEMKVMFPAGGHAPKIAIAVFHVLKSIV